MGTKNHLDRQPIANLSAIQAALASARASSSHSPRVFRRKARRSSVTSEGPGLLPILRGVFQNSINHLPPSRARFLVSIGGVNKPRVTRHCIKLAARPPVVRRSHNTLNRIIMYIVRKYNLSTNQTIAPINRLPARENAR